MWKETVRALQTGVLAEVAVVAFVVAFALVVVYAVTMSKAKREELKNQPLDDAPEFPLPKGPAPEETDHA